VHHADCGVAVVLRISLGNIDVEHIHFSGRNAGNNGRIRLQFFHIRVTVRPEMGSAASLTALVDMPGFFVDMRVQAATGRIIMSLGAKPSFVPYFSTTSIRSVATIICWEVVYRMRYLHVAV
jgi:hypothetical protein